jgi:hypothetical protein
MDFLMFIKVLLIGGGYILTYFFEIFYRLIGIDFHVPLNVYLDSLTVLRDTSYFLTFLKNHVHHVNDPFYNIVNLPTVFKYNFSNSKWIHLLLLHLNKQQVPFHILPEYSFFIKNELFYGRYNLGVDKPLIFNFFKHEKYEFFGKLLSTPAHTLNPIFTDILSDIHYKKANTRLASYYYPILHDTAQPFISVFYKPNGGLKYFESICRFLLDTSHIQYAPGHPTDLAQYRRLVLQNIGTIQNFNNNNYSFFIDLVTTNDRRHILDFINTVTYLRNPISIFQFDFTTKKGSDIENLHFFKMLYVAHLDYIFERLDMVQQSVIPSAMNLVQDIKGPLSDIKGPLSDIKGPLSDIKGPLSDIKGPLQETKGPLQETNMTVIYRQIFETLQTSTVWKERSFGGDLPREKIICLNDISTRVTEYTTPEEFRRLIEECYPYFDLQSYNYMENYNFNKNRAKMPYSILYEDPQLNFEYLSDKHNKMPIYTIKNTNFTYEYFRTLPTYEDKEYWKPMKRVIFDKR